MRRLILKMSVSVDGFVGGPNGEIDWVFKSLDVGASEWILDTLWQAGVHIMGSRTYQDMRAWWPTSAEAFAAPMNQIPKVVFCRSGARGASAASTTTALRDATRVRAAGVAGVAGASSDVAGYIAEWAGSTIASGELVEEIGRLKQQAGKDILAHGGARFARSLIQHGLIDEYRLLVHPVALGQGLPLFAALQRPQDLRLVNSTAFGGGAVAQIYHPA
ncbi:MAG: dihydrofolate reductase family protein [Steroidobacterales bacterium]